MALSAICPLHQEEMEEKDGQYGPYFSHRTDDGYCNGKRVKPYTNGGYQPTRPAPGSSQGFSGRDEEQVRGQIRTWLVSSLIQSRGLKPLTTDDVGTLNSHVTYVMTGKLPGSEEQFSTQGVSFTETPPEPEVEGF